MTEQKPAREVPVAAASEGSAVVDHLYGTRHPGDVAMAPIGTLVRTGEPVPAAGVWELVEHGGAGEAPCPRSGDRHTLGARHAAPPCPEGHGASWRYEHVAASALDIDPDPQVGSTAYATPSPDRPLVTGEDGLTPNWPA